MITTWNGIALSTGHESRPPRIPDGPLADRRVSRRQSLADLVVAIAVAATFVNALINSVPGVKGVVDCA